MSDKLTSLEEKITSNIQQPEKDEETNKITFEEYINDKILNNQNLDDEINKDELIKEIEEKVIDGQNYNNQINIYFENEDKKKIKDIKEKIENLNKGEKNEEEELKDLRFEEKKKEEIITPNNNINIKNKTKNFNFTLENNRRTLEQLYPRKKSDLDFLSEDLPKDKNREKILSVDYSQNYYSLSNRIETRKKPQFQFDINPEIYNEIIKVKPSNEESVIKPMNEFKELENNNNNNLKELSNNNKKDKNKKIIFKSQNKNKINYDNDFVSNYVNDGIFNIKNIVFPINKKKNFNIDFNEGNNDAVSQGLKSIKNKINFNNNDNNNNNNYNTIKSSYNPNNKNTNDYFFSLYRDFSNQNKNLQVLDNKILKISNKQKELYGNQSNSPKPNTLLNNMKINNPIIQSNNNKINMNNINDLLDSIGVNQKNLTIGNSYENKNKDYNLKDPKQKQRFMDNLKGELKQYNISKDIKLNKNSAFNEIDERIKQISEMNKKNVKKNNNDNDENVDNENIKIEHNVENNNDENNDNNNTDKEIEIVEKTEITVEKTVEKKKIDKNNENEIPQEEGN